jgi:L-ascorbate metabolism protein UlaG (beta-lactamase superfamily)
MRIDTPAGSILCDPWVNPAYFASWFPFPDNSQLDWESLGDCDYLYVSHLHRDHFDAAHLKRFVNKRATVLLPEYPTSQLEDELRDVGFTRFFKTVSDEVHELDGGLKVMIQALISPTSDRRLVALGLTRRCPGPEPTRRQANRSGQVCRAWPRPRAHAAILGRHLVPHGL